MGFKIFKDIGEILTLQSAVKKDGRKVKESDLSIVRDAVLVCENGKVVWLGPRADFRADLYAKAEIISLGGRTVLPGFVEPHTHLVFAGNRAHEFEWRMQGQTYQQISAKGGGIRYTVKQTREASEAQLQTLAQARATEFVRQGVTTLEVKSGYGLDLATETRSLQVARGLQGPRIITTYLGAHSASPDFADLDSYLEDLCANTLPRIAQQGLADRVDIYVEKGFFTVAHLQRYFTCAQKLGLALTGHFEQLSELGGTEAALEFAPQSVDHVVYINDATIDRLAQMPTTAVLLPASDFYLRMQYPRARAMIDAGARVALSTDFNPGTSPTQDLSLVGVLARLEMGMTLPEVIVAFTFGAASALGLEKQVGSLDLGMFCDFNVLSAGWQDLFYSVGQHPIESVYRAGERLATK